MTNLITNIINLITNSQINSGNNQNNDFVIIVFTSTVVSGLVSFILRYFFELKRQNDFQKEFKKYEFEIQMQVENIKTKEEMYKKIGELIYRTRNIARDLNNQVSFKTFPITLLDEFQKLKDEIVEFLYSNFLFLYKVGKFEIIHSYKRLLENYIICFSNTREFIKQKDDKRINNEKFELDMIYKNIDELRTNINFNISDKENTKWLKVL